MSFKTGINKQRRLVHCGILYSNHKNDADVYRATKKFEDIILKTFY